MKHNKGALPCVAELAESKHTRGSIRQLAQGGKPSKSVEHIREVFSFFSAKKLLSFMAARF